MSNLEESAEFLKQNRPNWDNYFMGLAMMASTRSTCPDRQVGAVIVKDKTVLATGYNGAPRGVTDCLSKGCRRINRNRSLGKQWDLCDAAHAEDNAITEAARKGGSSLSGATLYVTVRPCSMCLKRVINAGINKIFYLEDFADSNNMSEEFAREVGLEQIKLPKEEIMNVFKVAETILKSRE